MSVFTEYFWVWVISAIIILPLCFFAMKKWMKNNKLKNEAITVLENKKRYYKYLTREKLENCPEEDILTAGIIHNTRIESEDYDHVYENMNEDERIIYIICEAMNSIDSGKGTIRNFFNNEFYEKFFPMVGDAFRAVDADVLGDMMDAAQYLNYVIENDIEEEDEEKLGDYVNYNFSDFTNEFMTEVMTLKVHDKMAKFIIDHKESFIDPEDPNPEESAEIAKFLGLTQDDEEPVEEGDEESEDVSE